MAISFDRNTCCDLNETISREWLVTNGLGGYAAGTVAGVLTRMPHGLLVASPPNALQPQLLLAKIDEEITFDQRTYYLGTNEYRDGTFNPSGFVHLEAFRLEEGFPIFTYRLGGMDGLVLEKRIWMARGFNTTYIQYSVLQPPTLDKPAYKRNSSTGSLTSNSGRLAQANEHDERKPCIITLLPLTANRPYNTPQRGQKAPKMQVQVHRTEDTTIANEGDLYSQLLSRGSAGCTITANTIEVPYHLMATGQPENQATFIPTGVWYWNFLRRCDAAAGLPNTDDLYLPGVFKATLWPDSQATLTIIVSTEELTPQLYQYEAIASLYKKNIEQRQFILERALHPQPALQVTTEVKQSETTPHLLPVTTASDPYAGGQNYLQQLLYGSEHFIIHNHSTTSFNKRRKTNRPVNPNRGSQSKVVLVTDYFAQEHRTRDALIAIPGLLLVTERYTEAYQFLRNLADHFIGGILPDRLPTVQQALNDHSYSNADITLWYFYALDYYLRATSHYEFLEEIFPRLVESINRYKQGTHNGIRIDPTDGLLIAEKAGKALTWMNEYHQGRPITPRTGKPVELNALWYHALTLMQRWTERLEYIGHIGSSATYYQQQASHCKHSFQQHFWNAERGYLYDVIEGPGGNDPTLRVNQLFALSLPHPILDSAYRQQVFETITQHLLTPYGLRTMGAHEPGYHAHIEIDARNPQAYRQALHQGSCRVWLLGPYIDAMLNQCKETIAEQDSHLFQEYLWRKGMKLLEPLQERFNQGLLGMCENIFDGDSPQQVGPQSAALLSTAELLRIYNRLVRMRVEHPAGLLLL